MKLMMKPIFNALALTLAAGTVSAADKSQNEDGKLTAMVKLQHVVDAKDNGYDPNTGTAQMFKLKYVSPSIHGAKLGMGFYAVGDLLKNTDLDIDPGRPASGLYLNEAPNETPSMTTVLGELYLDYKLGDLNFFGGRMMFKSPLTISAESTVPDFHEAYGVKYKASTSFKLGLSHMTKMSIATRGANEFGLIGEGTGTGGITQSPYGPNQVVRGEFFDIATVALGPNAEETNGLTMLNAQYKPSKKMDLNAWAYLAHDIYNALYLEGNHVTPLKGKKLKLSAQYLTQKAAGDKLATGSFDADDIDFNMYGIKAALGSKKWGAFIAMNQSSGDTGMFNAFSGDPGFTSSQFSRNEYRENVTAYKVGGKYKVAPKWTITAGYANYGKSDTIVAVVPGIGQTGGSATGVTAQTDATELDIAVTFKPTKKTMIKVTHAQRTSEYDGFQGADLTMGHTRLIAVAKF